MTGDIFVAFPPNLTSQEIKKQKKYGLEVARAIMGVTKNQREAFKAKLFENRRYAEGNQDISQYLDELEIDGKNMYTNISYRPRPIAQKFKNVVVNGYLMREEYPSATATSKHIKDRKEKKKSDAQFRMEYGQVLQQLSQEAGVPLTDESEFTPSSKEELDLHFSMEDKEREELLMQELVSLALAENDIESLKNNALDDQFVGQLHGYYNYINSDGRLIIDYIQPEDAILDNSRFDDFRDAQFRGRYVRMSVSAVRSKFRLTADDEEKLFKCAQDNIGLFGNSSRRLEWEKDYRNAPTRPYDNYTIELAHVWWKTSKVVGYIEGKDRYGREVFDIDYKATSTDYKDTNGRKKVGFKYPETAFEGYFTASMNLCLEWGEQRNVLRKGQDKETLLSPFIYNMPYNKGRMLPNSLMNLMIDSIRNMDIAILKIKQLIAKATPDDYVIDINGLNNLDLGTGDELQPLDVMQIHAQTGRLYWNSKAEDGSTSPLPPIRANINPLDTKLRAYVDWYNTELNNIRDYLGVNEFRDGSGTSPRTGFKFMQAQTEASNTATWFLYRAYIKSTEELVRQVGIRIWDALNYGEVNEGYLKYIGKQNVEFIQKRKDITASSYDIDFKLGMTQNDKEVLESYINTALANGTLQLQDVLMVRRVQNPQVAEQLLTYTMAKRRKEKIEEDKANQESAANYAAQSGLAVEEAKQKGLQLQLQVEQTKQKEKADAEQISTLLKGTMDLMAHSFSSGIELPESYKPLIDLVLQNASSKTSLSLAINQQEQQAMAEQEEKQQLGQELQQAIQNGELDEESAMQIAQENGLQ